MSKDRDYWKSKFQYLVELASSKGMPVSTSRERLLAMGDLDDTRVSDLDAALLLYSIQWETDEVNELEDILDRAIRYQIGRAEVEHALHMTPGVRLYAWDVEVTRIGYGTRTIRVNAENEAVAREIADTLAGNFEYSEHHSEYEIGDAQLAD